MQSPVGFMIREHFLHGVACFSFDRCVYACSGSEAKCLRDSSLTKGRNSEKSYNGRSYTKEQIEKRFKKKNII